MPEFSMTPPTPSARHEHGTHFQALLEHSANLTTLLDRSGRILYQSPSVGQALGCDRTPTPGCPRNSLQALHPDDCERIAGQVLHAVPGMTLTLRPYRVKHANGSWRWLEGTAVNLLDDPQVQGILVQARDVTVQVNIQQRSHALEALSRALAGTHSTAEVVQVILLQGLQAMGAAAGEVVVVDDGGRLVTVLGSAGDAEWARRPGHQFLVDAPIPAAESLRQSRDLYLTGEDWHTLYPQLQRGPAADSCSTAVLTLAVNGRVLGAITLSFGDDRAFSETERQHLRSVASQCAVALERAELNARLQQQERLYRKLNEFSSDLVSIIALDGATLHVSPSITRMLGYLPEERIGVNAFEGLHPDDRSRVIQAFEDAVATRYTVLVTYRFQHKDGRWVWLESTGTNATDDPDLKGVLINTRDVTSRMEAEQARRVSERWLHLYGEQSDTLIQIFSPDGACVYVSPGAEGMLGYAPGELQTCVARELIHPDDRLQVDAACAAHTATPPYRLRRRDGTYLWAESSIQKITDESGALVELHVATRDISRRMAVEDALRVQLGRFQHLVDLTAEFAVQEGVEQHIESALAHCLDLTPYTYGFYFPLDGDRLIDPVSVGQATEEMLAWTLPLQQVHRTGTIGKALRRQAAVFVGPDQAVFDPPEPLPRLVWTTLAVLPVVVRGVLRGVMAFGTNEPVELDDSIRRLLLGVSQQASRAVERSVHLDELRQSREETLRALGLALEYRDYETKGHTDRVVRLTEQLGRALGFTGSDLEALRWGAFLHDTGKVAIPDAILLKPGKLDPEEWAVIQRHPDIGYEMLHHIPSLPASTLEVVLYHQERWNGSGYPRGLAGTDIPLAARVFAVVDVYDALTSERPYKKAWSHQEAVAQLRQDAGVLLDARVVHTFLCLTALEPPSIPDGAHA